MSIENQNVRMTEMSHSDTHKKNERENKERIELVHKEIESIESIYKEIELIDVEVKKFKDAVGNGKTEECSLIKEKIKSLVVNNPHDREFVLPPGLIIAEPYGDIIKHDIKNIQARFAFYSLAKGSLEDDDMEDFIPHWEHFEANWKGYYYTMLDYASRVKGKLEGDSTHVEESFVKEGVNMENFFKSLMEYITVSAENHKQSVIFSYQLHIPEDISSRVAPGVVFNKIANVILNPIRKSRAIHAKNVSVEAYLENNTTLLISVEDDGVGMDTETKQRVFEDGFTTTGGKGIGLAHADRILERMGIQIDIITTHAPKDAGNGEVHTRFEIRIPVSA